MWQYLYKRVFILVVVVTIFMPDPGLTRGNDFQDWLTELKAQALSEGVSPQTLETAFQRVKPIELVLRLDRNQPEFKLTLVDYLNRVITPSRIVKGVKQLNSNLELLEEVAARFRVQPRFLVALWGVETDFGQVTGSFPVVGALATLAYDPRRSAFFRKELLAALHILDKGYIDFGQLEGSWAGAFGGLQFLPTVFRQYAVDFNSDGRIDIWQDRGDLFASGANYLRKSGWRDDQTWGREIMMPPGFDQKLSGIEIVKKISWWQAKGIRRHDGSDLPARDLPASVIVPDSSSGRAFLVYNNFEVLLQWNRSYYYAVAVGLLSDLIQDEFEKK